jgi:hypothetical protein
VKDQNSFFPPDLSDKERASFEIGIKLGAIYHILSGIPISSNPKIIQSIEKGIEAAISCQPYVKEVEINLKKNQIKGEKSTEFDYDEIHGKIIEAKVVLEYQSTRIIAKIEWKDVLQYPLMFIDKIEQIE